MEIETGSGELLDHKHGEVDYGNGHSLLSNRTARRCRITVLYLAAVRDIEKPAPYSRNLVQSCVKSFQACANTTKNSTMLL